MTLLTPYTTTFAGRKVDSGKLSLDLEYKITKRQLQGDNKIVTEIKGPRYFPYKEG